jgi:hypothetical protein
MRTLRRAAERQINAILSPAERRRVEASGPCRNDDLRLTMLALATQQKRMSRPGVKYRIDKIDEYMHRRAIRAGIDVAERERRGAENGPPDDPILTVVRLALDGGPESN